MEAGAKEVRLELDRMLETAQPVGLCEIVTCSRERDDLNLEPVRDSALCAQHALHGSQLDDRVHIRVGTHARYAVRDGMLEEPCCPHLHVCGRERRARLCRGRNRIGERRRTEGFRRESAIRVSVQVDEPEAY